MRLRRAICLATALAAGALAACRDDSVTAPRAVPHMDASDGQPSEPSNVYVTPIEAANSSVDVTGITFAHYSRPTLVEITVSGSYDMIWNVGSGTGTSAGTVDAGGWWSYLYYSCTGSAWVQFTSGGYAPCRTPTSSWPWVDTVVVQGDGQAGKHPGPHASNYYCDTGDWPACYTFLGGPLVATVRPIATQVSVSAELADGLAGRTVTFTMTGADTVRQWEFVPDGGIVASRVGPGAQRSAQSSVGQVATPTGTMALRVSGRRGIGAVSRDVADGPPECIGNTAATCVEAVTQSGTMYVLATFHGVDQQASAHVTVTPDSATVTADSVDGVVGRTVTFHAGTRFGSPFTVVGWHWVPDSGIVASVVGKRPGRPALTRRNARVSAMGKTTAVSRDGTSGLPACVGSTDSTCQEVITESGTMYVEEMIAGVSQTAGVHVTAQPDSLRINPSSKSLDPGNTATFQATTSTTPFTVTAWTWNGVAPTNGHALTNLSACTAGSSSCMGEFYESGTLTCEAVMNGVTVLAFATVTVTPCAATGDSILDSPEVRKQMLDELAASNPSATPGTGVKKERAGLIFKRPDGSYYLKYIPDSTTTECFSHLQYVPGDSVGDVAIVTFHTHPSNDGDPVYGCPPDTLANGRVVRWAQRRNDGLRAPRANSSGNGGGSDQDWSVVRSSAIDGYTISKDGHVYMLPHDTTQVPVGDEANNPNVWHRKDKNSVCLKHGR